MDSAKFIRIPSSRYSFFRYAAAFIAGAVACGAQEFGAPEVREVEAPLIRAGRPPPVAQDGGAPLSPYQIGPVQLQPHASFSYRNSTGLPSQTGERVTSQIYTFSAGVDGDWGEHLSFAYEARKINHSAAGLRDSFNQSVHGSYAIGGQALTAHLSQSYSEHTSFLAETATQVRQKNWSTNLGIGYFAFPKIRIDADAGLSGRIAENLPNSRSWRTSVFANYVLSPRLSFGVGPTYSYHDVSTSPDFTTVSYTGRVNWAPLDKLRFGANIGQQVTNSAASSVPNRSSPTYGLNASYQLLPTTGFFATATRHTTASYFRSYATDSLSWRVGMNQRLLGHFSLGLNYGKSKNDYLPTSISALAARSDETTSWGATLSTRLFGRLSVATNYRKVETNSTLINRGLDSRQYGFQIGYNF